MLTYYNVLYSVIYQYRTAYYRTSPFVNAPEHTCTQIRAVNV